MSFHLVLDNAHYSGKRGQGLWDVGHAGPLTRGLGRMVLRREVTADGAGLAAIAFFTGRSPFAGSGRWWYPTPTPTRFRAQSLDFQAGEGCAAVWHRVVYICRS